MNAKTVNYTAEQTAKAVEMYQAHETVETIATALGKSVKSIVAKLSREKVYVAKARTSNQAGATKADLVAQIAQSLGISEDAAGSLEKATREVLQALASTLATIREIEAKADYVGD